VLGLHPLADGRCAAAVGLPFGALAAKTFAELVAAAARRGASSLQPWERHSALAIGLDLASARAFQREAAELGLVVREHDPRWRVSTCSGRPGCGSAWLATRPLAAEIARSGAADRSGVRRIHLAGCAKRCAAPRAADVQLVADAHGVEVELADGTRAHWPVAELVSRLLRAAEVAS